MDADQKDDPINQAKSLQSASPAMTPAGTNEHYDLTNNTEEPAQLSEIVDADQKYDPINQAKSQQSASPATEVFACMMTEHKPAPPTVAPPDAADEKTSYAGRSYSIVESKYLTAPVKDNLEKMGITRVTDASPVAIPPNINNTVSSVSTDDQKDDRSSIPSDQTVSKGQKQGFSPSHEVATPPNMNNTVSKTSKNTTYQPSRGTTLA